MGGGGRRYHHAVCIWAGRGGVWFHFLSFCIARKILCLRG